MNIPMMLPTEWIHNFLYASMPEGIAHAVELVLIAVGFLMPFLL
jgi:hypothetical protein